MRDMWHSVSHTFRTINSPKGIRLGEEEEKSYFFASIDSGRKSEKNERILRLLPQICGNPSDQELKFVYTTRILHTYQKIRDFTEGPKDGI